jgi:hypothetical protein
VSISPRDFAKTPPLASLVYLLAVLALITTHPYVGSWNDASRIATVQSLVESRSFVIDRTAFVGTGDKVSINDHFYSDKPPIPAVLGAAVYMPLYHCGLRLHLGSSIPYYLVTLLIVKLFSILGVVAFYLQLELAGLNAQSRLLASLALGIGSLYFTWSTTFNSHELAAAFLSLGFYFLLKARFQAPTRLNIGVTAFFLSLASTADMPTGIFYILFLPYILRDQRLRQVAVFYVLPLLVTVLPALALNYSIHHSIMPVQLFASYFQYSGSPWLNSSELSGMHINTPSFALTYGLLALVGPKGFLLYNPICAIALWGLARTIRQRGLLFHEAVVVASGSGILVLYYLLFTNNYGGWSYSIRWFVPILPLLFVFLYPFFQIYNQKRVILFRALLCLGVGIAFVGAVNPWSHGNLSEVPFMANIKEISNDLSALHNRLKPTP